MVEMERTFLVGNSQILNVEAQNIFANWVRRGWKFRNLRSWWGKWNKDASQFRSIDTFQFQLQLQLLLLFCNALSYWLMKLFTLCERDNNNGNNEKRNVSKLYIVGYMF